MIKKFAAWIFCALLLASAAGCSRIEQPESSAGSSQPSQTASGENSSVDPEEARLLWAEQLTACLAQHGLTADARRTCEITDEVIWNFVNGSSSCRENFPYDVWPELNDSQTTAYFPLADLQRMVEQIFGVAEWMPDVVQEHCDENGTRLELPLETGLPGIYGFEDMHAAVQPDGDVTVTLQLIDTLSFPGDGQYGTYVFSFVPMQDGEEEFLRLTGFALSASPESSSSSDETAANGEIPSEEMQEFSRQAEQITDCLSRYVMSEGLRQTGVPEDLDIWSFMLASIQYRDDFPYPVWPETSEDGMIGYFPAEDIQTTAAQLFGKTDWFPEFMRESMAPETMRLEMRLTEPFNAQYSYRNMQTERTGGNRITVSLELTDVSETESYGTFSFVFSVMEESGEKFLRLTECGPSR